MTDAIRVEGLADVRKSLRKLERTGKTREVQRALKSGAAVIATAARPLAPRGTGRLAASYRAGAAGTNAYVRSRLPYAAVHEYGGVISPRGVPIDIYPQRALTRAMDAKADVVASKVGEALDQVFQAAGWWRR